MHKLRRLIGTEKLKMIKIQKPLLYAKLMDYIKDYKTITEEMCRELLHEHELTVDAQYDAAFQKQLREKAMEEYNLRGEDIGEEAKKGYDQ